MRIHRIRWLRALVLPLLHRFGPGDITWRHPYTRERFRLHAFKHKGYWFHGRRREATTMEAFRHLTPRGGTVLEVGGHIGYLAMYFSQLVGPHGQVHVFEPGPNNLPYLRANTASCANLTLVEKGVADRPGSLTLHTEELTGQNNSFVVGFDVLARNVSRAPGVESAGETRPVEVEVVTLDEYVQATGLRPDVIKIDVEGFEFEVLEGARGILEEHRPVLMVEIQRKHEQVLTLLSDLGYRVHDLDQSRELRHAGDLPPESATNTFCFHREAHAQALAKLGVS